jgi:general secretion pathway protein A
MYTKYFGFNEKPFTLTPNPRFIYLSKHHKEAFAHLLYGINNHYGFIELIGEVGTGKTTVLRTLLSQLNEDTYRSALIFNPCLTGVELLRSINHEFGLHSESEYANELLEELNRFLLAENARGITVVLVIDEAQNLSPEILEQLRLISNLETENDKLIQIILAGQPELSALLALPELRQLNQRIAVRYRLRSMSMDETRTYIRHRMVVAGETGGVSFSRSALKLIHLSSHGLPRLINNICDRALLIGYGDERRRVTIFVVIRAIKELLNLHQGKRFLLAFAGIICFTIITGITLSVISSRSGRHARIHSSTSSLVSADNSSAGTPAPAKSSTPVSTTTAPNTPAPAQTLKTEVAAAVPKKKNLPVSQKTKQIPKKITTSENSQEVRALQQLLKQAGLYDDAIDGKYNRATAKAVSDFQMLAGIPRDKTVGDQTREALANYYTNTKVQSIPSTGNTK